MVPVPSTAHVLLCFENPVVLRLAVFVLACAQRVRHALQPIHKGACKVVRWVDLLTRPLNSSHFCGWQSPSTKHDERKVDRNHCCVS